MCNHERLLDYLYDELPAADRKAFEGHLHDCVECRTELAALGGTRRALTLWSPPDAELGFQVVRNAAVKPKPTFWKLAPSWGLAAAAGLLLAVGVAVANVEVRYEGNSVVVRAGWGRTAPAGDSATGPASATQVAVASEEWKNSLRLLDARLQQLERGGDRKVVAAVGPDTDNPEPRMSDAELLRAVRRIIAESETRQQHELALRVTQVIRDFDATRVGDLARVEQGLRQIQGLTDAELIRHRDTLNHLLRVTQQR